MENASALLRPLTQLNYLLGRLLALLLLLAKEWYTTKEVAIIEDIAEETVRGWCEKGRIKATKLPSGEWRIHKADLLLVQQFGLLPLPVDPNDNGRYRGEPGFAAMWFSRRQGASTDDARGP